MDFCHISPRSAFFVAAVQESPLPKETSTPSGMQWPGSALPSAEALSASRAFVHAVRLMQCGFLLMLRYAKVGSCWCMLMRAYAR